MDTSVSKDEETKTKQTETKDDGSMKMIVDMMQKQQDIVKGISDTVSNIVEDVRKLKGEKITAPKNFEKSNERDKDIPPLVSVAVREILGNDVMLKGLGTPDMPGFNLEITIPDSLHTPRQIEESNVQREDLKMIDGKVVGRDIVTYKTKDKRTKFVSNHAAVVESKKWAERIADQIRHEFNKSKLPEPNFFK